MRLAVARALYGSPELLVMDDALAAVDGGSLSLFDKAIRTKGEGALDNDGVEPASVLPEMDKIIFLQDGKISGIGTYGSACDCFRLCRDG